MSITDRIDNITHIKSQYRGEILPAPHACKIELTGRCNFRCAFCASGDKLRQRDDMSWSFYTRIIEDMRDAGVEELGLFYLGESFMLDWLPKACEYAKQVVKYPYVFITTNGSLATYDKVRDMMNAGLNSLKFSLNYSDADQLKQIARVSPRNWDKIITNIKAAHLARENTKSTCGLYASYIEYDEGQAGAMEPIIDELSPYLDEIYALPCYNQAGFVTHREQEMGMQPTVGNRGRARNLVDSIPCWALFTEAHITSNGHLTGCCFGHTPDFDFGDLNNVGFMDAWNSEKAKWFRRNHLQRAPEKTPCKNCFHL